jgi:DNA topoisomerase-1
MTRNNLPIATFAPDELARLARLRYVTDEVVGYSRERNGEGFYYLGARGVRIRDRQLLKRIETLAIPPAWTDVWICRFAEGHLQATGRDDRQRKQYIYHERWREISNLAKFLRLADCVRFLPALRQSITRDLRQRHLTRTRVLAGMVALLDLTSIRIGNEEYVRQNKSYGLATLRTRHVTIHRGRAELRFRAKGGAPREVTVEDKRLVRLLTELKRLPNAHLFQYTDADDKIHRADAIAVNEYLRERTGHAFTAKEFRTWKASAMAAGRLFPQRGAETLTARKKVIKNVLAEVAEALANTPTVCRKYYIHSGLLQTFEDGSFGDLMTGRAPRPRHHMSADETVLARFLRRWEPSPSRSRNRK